MTQRLPAYVDNRLHRLTRRHKRYLTEPALLAPLAASTTALQLRDIDLLGRLLDTYVAARIRPELELIELEGEPLRLLAAYFGATLTLPGIAGIVLTVGTAVDANILIYERIREELAVGSTPWAAVNAGFDKAFSAIADSNVTMLMSGGVLFLFGSGPVRGFAVTLCIGIATSMFTALIGSRALIHLAYGRRRRIERLATRQLHLVAPSSEEAIVIERVLPADPPAKSVIATR